MLEKEGKLIKRRYCVHCGARWRNFAIREPQTSKNKRVFFVWPPQLATHTRARARAHWVREKRRKKGRRKERNVDVYTSHGREVEGAVAPTHTHLVTFLPGLRFAMPATPSLHQPSIVRAEKLIEL